MGQNNSKKNKLKYNSSINHQNENKSKEKNENINKLKEKNENINKLKINKSYLEYINSINEHSDWIESVKIFPSGNIISASNDCSINIYDGLNYKIIQNIKSAHKGSIINLFIKDENNFATCSYDKCINIWIKENNKFILKESIINAHNGRITNLIYCINDNIISCSEDYKIKIWELINNKYQLLTILMHSNDKCAILLLEDKNMLISSGYDGTKIWKIYEKGMNIDFNYYFKEVFCGCWNGLNRIDENRIIIGDEKTLKIISIKKMKILQSIKIPFRCNGIITIEEKGIILMGGWSKDIIIYKSNNYKYLTTIKDAHSEYIVGFCKLKNNLILSFSGDTTIKIWSLNL